MTISAVSCTYLDRAYGKHNEEWRWIAPFWRPRQHSMATVNRVWLAHVGGHAWKYKRTFGNGMPSLSLSSAHAKRKESVTFRVCGSSTKRYRRMEIIQNWLTPTSSFSTVTLRWLPDWVLRKHHQDFNSSWAELLENYIYGAFDLEFRESEISWRRFKCIELGPRNRDIKKVASFAKRYY